MTRRGADRRASARALDPALASTAKDPAKAPNAALDTDPKAPAMTSLDATALDADPEGLAFLCDVLGTGPSAASQPKRQSDLLPPQSPRSRMIPARLTRRLGRPGLPDGAAPLTRRFRLQGTPARFGVIGSTALIALMIAVSPAKPTVPREDARPPAAATQEAPETRKDGPAPSRPVRTVTRLAALEAEPLACPRVRRKLWVEGEGWVVRSVSKC